MFFIQSDITIQSSWTLHDISSAISSALNIPNLMLDQTGRFDEIAVYISICFGLEFGICRTDKDLPQTFHLFITSIVTAFDFDGSEKEVDATKYVLLLLKKAGIRASARDPRLLY